MYRKTTFLDRFSCALSISTNIFLFENFVSRWSLKLFLQSPYFFTRHVCFFRDISKGAGPFDWNWQFSREFMKQILCQKQRFLLRILKLFLSNFVFFHPYKYLFYLIMNKPVFSSLTLKKLSLLLRR